MHLLLQPRSALRFVHVMSVNPFILETPLQFILQFWISTHVYAFWISQIDSVSFVNFQLLKELDAPVEYIILPTFAYEHKIFVGPFSRKFPRAQIWVAPRQWSWPLNLPLEFFGIFRAKALKDEDTSTPWADEIEQKVLSSPEVGMNISSLVSFSPKT